MAIPKVTPEAIPELLPMPAIPGLLLAQEPPGEVSLNVAVDPWHTNDGPLMAAGVGLTVTDLVTEQPAPGEKVIVTVPAETPVTMPDEDPTVALVGSLLLQAPEPTGSENV